MLRYKFQFAITYKLTENNSDRVCIDTEHKNKKKRRPFLCERWIGAIETHNFHRAPRSLTKKKKGKEVVDFLQTIYSKSMESNRK